MVFAAQHVAGVPAAFAEKRVARCWATLPECRPAPNPVNDSARIASTLKDAGFDGRVPPRSPGGYQARFARFCRARDADITVVYYAAGIEWTAPTI
jgi:uncharacterized caspase-like protein